MGAQPVPPWPQSRPMTTPVDPSTPPPPPPPSVVPSEPAPFTKVRELLAKHAPASRSSTGEAAEDPRDWITPEDLNVARASMRRCLERDIACVCPGHREPLPHAKSECKRMRAVLERGGKWPLFG